MFPVYEVKYAMFSLFRVIAKGPAWELFDWLALWVEVYHIPHPALRHNGGRHCLWNYSIYI